MLFFTSLHQVTFQTLSSHYILICFHHLYTEKNSGHITPRKPVILDLELTREIISPRAWILFLLSVIQNHLRVCALKSLNLCFLSMEFGTRDLRLRPLIFTLLPGCLVFRDKEAWLNAAKSREVCSKSMGSLIFFYRSREIKSWVRSR